MDVYNIYQEFDWVNKVLFSSKTKDHIEGSLNLFNNFMNKWSFEMSKDLKITLLKDFNNNYSEHSEDIQKNGVI
jgi:hypothetical protein